MLYEVITIPLADELVDKGIIVLNDRGTIYTKDNIKERLSIRNYMQEARELGLAFESTSRFDAKDVHRITSYNVCYTKLLR